MALLRLRGTASFRKGLEKMQAGPPVFASRYHGDEWMQARQTASTLQLSLGHAELQSALVNEPRQALRSTAVEMATSVAKYLVMPSNT